MKNGRFNSGLNLYLLARLLALNNYKDNDIEHHVINLRLYISMKIEKGKKRTHEFLIRFVQQLDGYVTLQSSFNLHQSFNAVLTMQDSWVAARLLIILRDSQHYCYDSTQSCRWNSFCSCQFCGNNFPEKLEAKVQRRVI